MVFVEFVIQSDLDLGDMKFYEINGLLGIHCPNRFSMHRNNNLLIYYAFVRITKTKFASIFHEKLLMHGI